MKEQTVALSIDAPVLAAGEPYGAMRLSEFPEDGQCGVIEQACRLESAPV